MCVIKGHPKWLAVDLIFRCSSDNLLMTLMFDQIYTKSLMLKSIVNDLNLSMDFVSKLKAKSIAQVGLCAYVDNDFTCHFVFVLGLLC